MARPINLKKLAKHVVVRKQHRQSGSVLNWRDRRTDLYDVRYLQES